MNRLFATATTAVLAATGTYSFLTWRQISHIESNRVVSKPSISDSFKHSRSVKEIVNPRGHITQHTSHSITIAAPKGVSDEVLLARFVNGFFGGYVFAPEGTVLRALGRRLVDLTRMPLVSLSLNRELSSDT